MRIVSSSLCEKGKARSVNQDAIFSSCTDKWGVFMVADGMGGYENGERASSEAVEAVRIWTEKVQELEQLETPELIRQLKEVLSASNDKIKNETPAGMKCGCTVVLMVLIRRECILLTLGDSRCYRLQRSRFHKELAQLTSDDVVGGNGPQKNRLTNALGVRIPMACRVQIIPSVGKHTYFICTDGVYKYCEEEELLSALKNTRWGNVSAVLQTLQGKIEERGSGDNYSAFLIRIQS